MRREKVTWCFVQSAEGRRRRKRRGGKLGGGKEESEKREEGEEQRGEDGYSCDTVASNLGDEQEAARNRSKLLFSSPWLSPTA